MLPSELYNVANSSWEWGGMSDVNFSFFSSVNIFQFSWGPGHCCACAPEGSACAPEGSAVLAGGEGPACLWGLQLAAVQAVSKSLSSNKTEIKTKQTLHNMKRQSACHFCSWKQYCFPSKNAMVQDCFGSSSNTKPLSIALGILLVSLIQTCANHHSHCQNPTLPPLMRTYLSLFSYTLHDVFCLHQKKAWEKCVKILATNTYKRNFMPEQQSHK